MAAAAAVVDFFMKLRRSPAPALAAAPAPALALGVTKVRDNGLRQTKFAHPTKNSMPRRAMARRRRGQVDKPCHPPCRSGRAVPRGCANRCQDLLKGHPPERSALHGHKHIAHVEAARRLRLARRTVLIGVEVSDARCKLSLTAIHLHAQRTCARAGPCGREHAFLKIAYSCGLRQAETEASVRVRHDDGATGTLERGTHPLRTTPRSRSRSASP